MGIRHQLSSHVDSSLESAFGDDKGLADAPGFLNSAYFMEYMMAPSGEYFNFSDAVNGVKCNMMMFWFAKRLNDLSLLWLENQHLKNTSVEFVEERLLPCLMIFALNQDLRNIQQPVRRFWCNRGATPVFIYRGGWDSQKDSYLAVKGGSPRTPHAHMDAGSFVYEKNGVRWAMDSWNGRIISVWRARVWIYGINLRKDSVGMYFVSTIWRIILLR